MTERSEQYKLIKATIDSWPQWKKDMAYQFMYPPKEEPEHTMTYLEAAKRIEEHMEIHFSKEYPRAIKITEALEMAVKLLYKADKESKASLCLMRELDKCNEYCDGWNIYEDCYVPNE